MIYIFTFLGEFGFELLNWQGVIRKFSRTISTSDKIVCCSRADLYPFYEMADIYIDISEIKLFKQSRATWYWASPIRERLDWNFIESLGFDRRLKAEIKSFVLDRLRTTDQIRDDDAYRFIYSSGKFELNGCTFGCARHGLAIDALSAVYDKSKSVFPAYSKKMEKLRLFLFNTMKFLDRNKDGDIFNQLALKNNHYQRIEPDFNILNSVEEQLGWSLTEPFVLCQTRTRDTTQPSRDLLPTEDMAKLIAALAHEVKVVMLSFRTGRWLDSYSEFKDAPNCFGYFCESFPQQACLIHAAAHCLFFTEGDFGSHIYVPPFLGKDVTAIAPQTVYRIGTTPVEFWNRNVFHFGGRILPEISEDVFSSEESMMALAEDILNRVNDHPPTVEADQSSGP